MTVDLVLPAVRGTASASGALTYTVALAQQLAASSTFDPRVLCVGEVGRSTTDDGVTWVPVSTKLGPASLSYHLGLRRHVREEAAELPRHMVHAQRPDYLWHFHRHVRPKPSTVCTLHGTHVRTVRATRGRVAGWLYERVQRAALREVDTVIAVSRDTETFFLNLYPWLEGRTQTIPVGVDTRVFRPRDRSDARGQLGLPADTRIVLFVGRLHRDKNVPLLLETMARLNAARADVSLWLVGEGPEELELKRMAQELGIAGHCHFVGRLDQSSVAHYMNAADLLVLQSVWEGMPTVVLEALASGRPCVSTRVGDVEDAVVDGETGYVVDDEPEAVAEGIGKVLARRPEDWTDACARMGRQFDWSVIAERTAQVYRQAAQRDRE